MSTGKLATLPKLSGTVNRIYFRPGGGMVIRTVSSAGKYSFSLVDLNGTVTATFPDTTESANTRLLAYLP